MWNAHYDILGRIDKLSKNSIENPIRMQGQYEDEETGLYYNRFRYYDPNISAYVSQDPLGLGAGENVYSYVKNSFGWCDPLGLSGCKNAGSSAETPKGKTHRHHSDPKFMGGDPKQKLTDIPEQDHKDLHKEMNEFLEKKTNANGDTMRPKRGNSGAKIQENFTRKERLDALSEFYNGTGSKYKSVADDFFAQHPTLK